MLFSWPHSHPVSPDLANRAERALHTRVAKTICYAGQHSQAAQTRSCCLLSHRARGAHGEKRKASAVPGEQVHAASMQIQQPSAEAAAAAALCSAGALGSACAWSDRKQKKRVNNGEGGRGCVLKLLFQLYLALALHRAIAQRTLAFREGHRTTLNTPQFRVSPHLLCLVPRP